MHERERAVEESRLLPGQRARAGRGRAGRARWRRRKGGRRAEEARRRMRPSAPLARPISRSVGRPASQPARELQLAPDSWLQSGARISARRGAKGPESALSNSDNKQPTTTAAAAAQQQQQELSEKQATSWLLLLLLLNQLVGSHTRARQSGPKRALCGRKSPSELAASSAAAARALNSTALHSAGRNSVRATGQRGRRKLPLRCVFLSLAGPLPSSLAGLHKLGRSPAQPCPARPGPAQARV